MTGKRQPTIIDVARLSGVSKTTVARVLSGVGAVHAETRRRVEEAVRDSGYERNHLAFGLRTGRSGTLGLVIPDLSNPYWADLARGAQDEAEAEKRSLLIFSSDWDAERERRHLQALRQARVDGVLINPAVTDDVTLLRQAEAPVVVLGSSGERFPEFSSARSDVAQGVRLALDHLIGLGHRHVGLVIGRDRLGRSRFVAEARAHWQRQGLDAALLPAEEATYTVESGQAATARLFERAPGMTAVFAANDLMAVGAILAARAAGLACPDDISIMGMDGVEAGSFTDPGLTTVDKPRYDIGVAATRLLLGAIDGTGETAHAVLPCRLVERASVAAPPALRTVRKKSA